MAKCQVEGCDGILSIIGRSEAVCSRCGTEHRKLDTGWMAEGGSSKSRLI